MDVDALIAPLPGTPIQEPSSPGPATGLDGGASVGTTGQPASSGSPMDPMQQIMVLMQSLIQMNIDKEKSSNHKMANARLDEKKVHNLKTFDNDPSKWKEWRKHFHNGVKECDDSFATLIEAFDKSAEEISELEYDPTQSQQAVNLHIRLSNATTGFAHNIVERGQEQQRRRSLEVVESAVRPKDRFPHDGPRP